MKNLNGNFTDGGGIMCVSVFCLFSRNLLSFFFGYAVIDSCGHEDIEAEELMSIGFVQGCIWICSETPACTKIQRIC